MTVYKFSLWIFTLFACIYPAAAHVVSINSVTQFNKLYTSKKPIITLYSASWCGPCKTMKPHFIKASQKFPDISFCLVDIEKKGLKKISADIKGLPTTIFSYRGNIIMQEQGSMSKTQFEEACSRFQTMVRAPRHSQPPKKGTPLIKQVPRQR